MRWTCCDRHLSPPRQPPLCRPWRMKERARASGSRNLPVYPGLLNHPEFAAVRAHVPNAPAGVDDHLANAGVFGRQLHYAQISICRIESHNGVRADLVGEHIACTIHGDRVRTAVRAARKVVFANVRRRDRIEVQQFPVAIERHPERAVRGGSNTARCAAGAGVEFADLAGLRVDPPELVCSHAAYPDVALMVQRETVWIARHLVFSNLAGAHVESAYAAGALHGEPDGALAVAHQRVRIAARGGLVLGDLAGRRIEMPDGAVTISGVPGRVVGVDQ